MSKWEQKRYEIAQRLDAGEPAASIAQSLRVKNDHFRQICKRLGLSIIDNKLTGPGDIQPNRLVNVPLDWLAPDPSQPRKQFDPVSLEHLANALKQRQESPVSFVRAAQGSEKPLTIRHGERRWRAAKLAGLKTIQGILVQDDSDNAEKIYAQAADNQGQPLTPWDWALTCQQLNSAGKTPQQISDDLARHGISGMSRPVISNLIRLKKLPENAQKMIEQGYLTPSHGKYLLAIKSEKVLDKVVEAIVVFKNNNNSTTLAPSTKQVAQWANKQFQALHNKLVYDNYAMDGCGKCQHKKDSVGHSEPIYAYCCNPDTACFDNKIKDLQKAKQKAPEQTGQLHQEEAVFEREMDQEAQQMEQARQNFSLTQKQPEKTDDKEALLEKIKQLPLKQKLILFGRLIGEMEDTNEQLWKETTEEITARYSGFGTICLNFSTSIISKYLTEDTIRHHARRVGIRSQELQQKEIDI